MSKVRSRSFVIVWVLFFVFLFSNFANGQAMASYLFLEVIDSNQKPVSDAKVETKPANSQKISQTEENGKFKFGFLNLGITQFSSLFIITRPDYYPFYDFGTLRGESDRRLKIELLK